MDALACLAGNMSIARTIKSGKCNLLIIGDSINTTGTADSIFRTWRPDYGWVGFGAPCSGGADASTGAFRTSGIQAQSFHTGLTYDGTNGPNSLAAWTMYTGTTGYGCSSIFDGDTIGAAGTAFANRVIESVWQSPTSFPRGYRDWVHNYAITAKYMHLANSVGCQSFEVSVRNSFGNTTYASVTAQSSRNATPTFTTSTVNIASRAYSDDNAVPIIVVRPTVGTTPANNDNLVHVAMRMYQTDATRGLQMTNMALGGSKASQWSDATKWSAASIAAFAEFLDLDVVYIWLGQNDVGEATATQFSGYITTLMDRFVSARSSIKFLLISPYQASSSSTRYSEYSDALRTIASTRQDTLFLDLWRAAGGFIGTASTIYTYVNGNFLSDGTHPSNGAGTNYFQGVVWRLIETAANNKIRKAGDFL